MKNRRHATLLAIPCFFLLLALVGLALSTESRDDFEEQAEQGSNQGDQGDQGDSEPDPNGQQSGDSQNQQAEGSEGQGHRPITIHTENGDIIIELDENGQPVRISQGETFVPTQPGRVLSPDPDGGLVGFRVTRDGLLEPVPRDDVRPRDFLLEPFSRGVRITTPDDAEITLRPSEEGTLTGVEVTGAGARSDLTADEDGHITIQSADDLAPGVEVDPDTLPLVIAAETGPVRLDLEPTGEIVASQPADEPLTVDPDDLSAIRVNEDGELEFVPLDEVGPDDTLLVPTVDGFDLVRPDGSRVEFRRDGENDGLTATEVTPDGQEFELTPNPDGSVTLSDGTTVGPIDIAEDGGTIEQMVDRASNLPWPWVAGAIALLALLSIGTAIYLHRNRPDDPFDYSQFADSTGVPEDQFEKFLAILLADSDPGRAIRLAFYSTERGLGGLPPRRADETPFEWHSRVEQHRPQLAVPLAPICDMFARARFASGQATATDRDLMVEHLRELNAVANRNAENLAGV